MKLMRRYSLLCLGFLVSCSSQQPQSKIASQSSTSSPSALGFHLMQQAGPETVRSYFLDAAEEFDVPADLLMAVGQVETNWTQVGPTIDGGWGVMHLVENKNADTLGEAAKLIHVDRQAVKDDARTNIRAAAALLAHLASPERDTFKHLTDWFAVLKTFSGLKDPSLRDDQARLYFAALRDGAQSKTITGSVVSLMPHTEIELPAAEIPEPAPDYPGAKNELTQCNFDEGRDSVKIDTLTTHWIGIGTFNGALDHYKDCGHPMDASTHFLISKKGEIAQVVRVADTAWHAGVMGFPTNNRRSIAVTHEVDYLHPDDWQPAMMKASAELAAFFTTKYQIPRVHQTANDRTSPGIRGHSDMPGMDAFGNHTECPHLPWDLWFKYLDDATDKGL